MKLIARASTFAKALVDKSDGKPAVAKAMAGKPYMFYVYILRSQQTPQEIYKGLTNNPSKRLQKHNRGEVKHTSKYTPWKMIFFAGFETHDKALNFERYLKSGSGIAFMRKRLILPE